MYIIWCCARGVTFLFKLKNMSGDWKDTVIPLIHMCKE